MDNSNYKLLLVDDETDILEFLGYNLKKEGYHVYTATSGKRGLEMTQKVHPHLILLDVMMPDVDGINVCRELRQMSIFEKTIIVFLTARGEDYSQIAGFEAGADDYITKPIKPRLLISRINAILKRMYAEEATSGLVKLNNITIDKERYIVIRDNKEISLPKKEFELLLFLTSKPNKVFSREEIFRNIWGSEVVVGDRTLDVHIRKLREKIGLDKIKTYKGIGYSYV